MLTSRLVGRGSLSFASNVASRAARTGLRVSYPLHSQKRTLLEGWGVPQPPGNIVGTVNDPVPVPPKHEIHGSYHWDFERVLAIALIPLTVVPLATGGMAPAADALFGGLLVAHSTFGAGSCITDYIPKRKFPRGHYVCMGLLYTASLAALYGVYKLETEDEGIVGSIRKIWKA